MAQEKKKKGEDRQEITLLPSAAANVVSLVTRSTSASVQLGTFIGGLAISTARITTLTGLEVSRALIEGVFRQAGRDVADRSLGEHGRSEAEGLLERSIATLHSTITNISFAASTGFYLSSTVLSSGGDISQQLLVFLDSVFGNTESSRAIASIVTLVRREFANPATGQEGERVGVGDLLVGLCGMALLQRWCRKITDAENQEAKVEEVIWDVVVLNDGRRADVVADNVGTNQKSIRRAGSMSFATTGGHDVVETIERRPFDDSDDDLPEMNLKKKILKSLGEGSSVSITTETKIERIITLDFSGPSRDISPPPGLEIIEKEELTKDSRHTNRVVYRVTRHKIRGTDITSMGSGDNAEEAIELSSDGEDEPVMSQRIMSATDLTSSRSSNNNSGVGIAFEVPKEAPLDNRDQSYDSSKSAEVSTPKTARSSLLPLPKGSTSVTRVANQKRSRKSPGVLSPGLSSPPNEVDSPATKKAMVSKPTTSLSKSRPKASEKKGSFRNAIRGSSTAISHMWNKETSPDSSTKQATKPAWGTPSPKYPNSDAQSCSTIPLRDAPRPPQRGNPNFFTSRDLGSMQAIDRSASRTSYYSVHEQRRDSVVSHTDTYSTHSADTRPSSPITFRSQLKVPNNLLRAPSENNMLDPPGSSKGHRKRYSDVYTLNADSVQSLSIVKPRRSAFQDSETLENLMQTGKMKGLFPEHHLVRNIQRFVRFSSASYGSHFLRIMGIAASSSTPEINTDHHHEHHSFSSHTQLPADTILVSSFVDPQEGTVYFVTLDHESRAVVLTCRGTLGFQDVLTDLTFDYDDLTYCGKIYSAHSGIHSSARKLLDGGNNRVMATIAAALEEFPSYGLVLCGHSLGGSVASLLAILISEPATDPNSTAFVTCSQPHAQQLLLTYSTSEKSTAPSRIFLPPGRPIHVYAYGPPATVSQSLRLATRGLITTIVNGQDLVPFLSLGVLHDFQAVALAFKTDDSGVQSKFRNRIISGLTASLKDKWYNNTAPGFGVADLDEDQWAFSALKVLRASMQFPKLLPPGEVFLVETMPVLQRHAFVRDDSGNLGRPAVRSVLKYVRDVEKRFREVRFGGSMLLDHSPGRYEASLAALSKGVLNQAN